MTKYNVHVTEAEQRRGWWLEVEAQEPILAAERAERIAWKVQGGQLHNFFADEVEEIM